VCVFPHGISKTDAARITKLDIDMFHRESWKLIDFGIKRSKVKVASHKKLPAWDFAFLPVLSSSGGRAIGSRGPDDSCVRGEVEAISLTPNNP